MSENDPSREPVKLDYAAPPPRRGRSFLGIIVGILGITVGMFGMLMLINGILGVIYVLSHSNRTVLRGDLFEAVMLLIIGSFCLAVSIRWCSAAGRMMRGDASTAGGNRC